MLLKLKAGAEPAIERWGCRVSKEEEDGFVVVMKGILLLLFISFRVCKDKLAANGAVDSQRASHGRGLTGREEA
jgi:hypothetical protein